MAGKIIRTHIRYQRNDIEAVFKKSPVFFNRIQPVKIINISKQGIAIYSSQALKPHNHLNITLCFKQGERFLLDGQVVHSFGQQSQSRRDEFVELFINGVAEPIPLPFKY
ncbi:MAG: PilZ domain-containing protein, partial [Methylobacter sp.]|nr:PilZ domain-containing protein [Methylobacter sp.]